MPAMGVTGGFAVPRPRAQAGFNLAAPGAFSNGAVVTAAPLWVGPRVTPGAYQWYRGAASISGATSASYVIASAQDSAQTLACYASASNPWGSGVAVARRFITLA